MKQQNLERGKILMEQSRYDLAEKTLKTALADQPEHAETLGLLSYACHRLGKREEGLSFAKDALKLDAFNLDALFTICEISVIHDKYPLFLEKIQQAKTIAPYNPHFQYLHAFYHFRKGEWKEAKDLSLAGLKIVPTSQNLLNVHAKSLFNLKENKAADESLSYALRLNPWNHKSLESKGWLALEEGNWEAAQQYFRDVLRQNPNAKNAKEGLVHALKAKIPFYKYLIKFDIWNKRNKLLVQYFILGSLVLLVPVVGLLYKYEETVYEKYLLMLGYLILSPILMMGFLGIARRVSDIYIFKQPATKHLLSKKEQESVKGCFWVAIVLFFYCLFLLIVLLRR